MEKAEKISLIDAPTYSPATVYDKPCVGEWVDGWVGGWMDGWVDVWMGE